MSCGIPLRIAALDPSRVMRFYGDLFGWEFSAAGSEGPWTVRERLGEIRIAAPVGSYVGTVAVTSVDACLANVEALGGVVLAPKVAVAGVGYLAYCRDTESNPFGIMQFDRQAGLREPEQAQAA